MTATLNGPSGATVPLESGVAETVGVHSLPVVGRDARERAAAGGRVDVLRHRDRRPRGHDDGGSGRSRSTTRSARSPSADGRAKAKSRASSSRAGRRRRPASSGGTASTVATFHLPHLAAGAHRVTWKGEEAAGKYLMRVDATSSDRHELPRRAVLAPVTRWAYGLAPRKLHSRALAQPSAAPVVRPAQRNADVSCRCRQSSRSEYHPISLEWCALRATTCVRR